MDIGFLNVLFDRDLMISVVAAVFAFATIVTLGLPFLQRDSLGIRMKSVSARREELRQKHHAALILFQDANRGDGVDDNDRYEKREEDSVHGVLIGCLVKRPAWVGGVGRCRHVRLAPESETGFLPQ